MPTEGTAKGAEPAPSGDDADGTIGHFRDHGWMRVPQAFSEDAAAAMRAVVWRALATAGIAADRRETWTVERPAHLQKIKDDPAFRAVGSARLLGAIDRLFDGRPYPAPRNWGALFLAFPQDAAWSLPTGGWHADAHYASPLWPLSGVKSLALLGDVVPRGGGTLLVSGSHRLIHGWMSAHPPPAGMRSAELRARLREHPYLRDLHSAGEREGRIARFMERTEYSDGIPLRIVEMTGAAGDVYLLHPLVMHAAAPNAAQAPRFLLSGGITMDNWGWSTPAG